MFTGIIIGTGKVTKLNPKTKEQKCHTNGLLILVSMQEV